jgi:hypothetical protein
MTKQQKRRVGIWFEWLKLKRKESSRKKAQDAQERKRLCFAARA